MPVVNLSPVGGVAAQFLDNNGNVLSGGKLFTYAAGTTTPAATYTSSLGVTAQPNPIVLDAAGRVPNSGEIWLTDGVIYKFVLKTNADVTIGTYDNIPGINPSVYASEVNFTGFNGQTGVVQDLSDNDGSDWIGFEQAGAGAVARSAQNKMREIVSVVDFGAVGDGVADDTAAIQAAIDSFPNQGSPNWQPFTLVFPAGSYKVTSTITLTNQQHGEIVGYGAKIIGDFNDVLFQYGAAGTGMLWHSMRGLTLEQSNTGANAKAFDMRDVYSCSIVDCFFYGGLTTGYMQGNNNIFMQCTWRGISAGTSCLMVCGEGANNQNNTFLNCAFEQVDGFGLCLQSDTAYVGQTYILSSYFEFCDPVALYIKNNQSAVIDGCYFNLSANTGGIRMDGGIGPRYENSPVIVRNCSVLGFSSPPSFVLETSSTAPNLLFDNNQVVSGSSDPVNFYGNAPNSVNAAGTRRNPFVANAEYFNITAPNTYPDGWTLGGSLGATTQIAQFAPYGAGAGIAVPNGTYIYQQINVPANALIKVTIVAKVSGVSAVAALQLWSLGLGSQYAEASTTNASATTLTVYLNSSTRSSATAFLLLLRNTGAGGTADFCNIFIEDLTN